MRRDYRLDEKDSVCINTWLRFDAIEVVGSLMLMLAARFALAPALLLMVVFVLFRVFTRFRASMRYKKVFFG